MVSAAQHLQWGPQPFRNEEDTLDSDERRARAEARRQKALEMGARLRVLRAVKGYSQAKLSQLTGLSRQYLSEVEKGKRPRPRCQTLAGLAAALEVGVDELKGTVPLRDAPDPGARDNGGAAPSVAPRLPDDPPAGATPDVAAAVRGAFALTGIVPDGLETIDTVAKLLGALSPGVVVLHRQYPDGSELLYIRLPPGTATPPE